MSIVDKLERSIASLFPKSGGPREPLELQREFLDSLAKKAIAGPRGERLFPFDRIRIELLAEDAERRAALEALFAPEKLLGPVRAELAAARIPAPENLVITLVCSPEAEANLAVSFTKWEPPPPEPVAEPEAPKFHPIRLVALKGAACESEFLCGKEHINIGREETVRDSEGRLIRRNDLFFPDPADEASASVSREHAHLRFDGTVGGWRVHDDGSRFGTALFRAGRRVEVPPHSARGVLLRPGDEVYLAEARLRVDTVAAVETPPVPEPQPMPESENT
jgi:hypothetical protein